MTATKSIDLTRVRELMQHDDPPLSAEEAAAEMGIGRHAFTAARDIVYLTQEELSAEEWALVGQAIEKVTSYDIQAAKDLVAPVLYRHFGETSGNHRGGPPKTRDAITKKFLQAYTTLTDTMRMADQIVVPWLRAREREEVLEDLKDAKEGVERLIHIIEQGGTHNAAD